MSDEKPYLSIIIPPSIAFIIYGNITSVSVSALFVAGIIPGIITGMGTIIVAYIISRKRGYRGINERASFKEIMIALKESFWAILSPVIILGGIYAGIFTPTEAAVVAVFYSLFVAMVIYRSISFRDMIFILADASVTSSVIMFIVAFAGIFTWATSVIGIVGMFYCRHYLGRFWTAETTLMSGHQVVNRGPYGVVRHPIYSFAIAMYVGVGIVFPVWWNLLLVSAIAGAYALKAREEDRFLEEKLEGYREYKERVRYRIIPWVW